MQVDVNGRAVQLSDMGWLENRDEWDEEVARAIAAIDKVDLTEDHWVVIREARAYYEETGVNPELRGFCKRLKSKYGEDKSSKQYIYDLFPFGLIKSANKIAGLTRPTGCS